MAREEVENPRKVRESLLAYLKRKGEFALTRYPKPDRILLSDYVYKSSFFTIGRGAARRGPRCQYRLPR
jgi:hypothetical protein